MPKYGLVNTITARQLKDVTKTQLRAFEMNHLRILNASTTSTILVQNHNHWNQPQFNNASNPICYTTYEFLWRIRGATNVDKATDDVKPLFDGRLQIRRMETTELVSDAIDCRTYRLQPHKPERGPEAFSVQIVSSLNECNTS